jgi:two-component system LytT family response regulator
MKAAIIDDELHGIKSLVYEIDQYCPDVNILATFQDPYQAIKELPKLELDILFLDIAMPEMDGFELLSNLPERPFEIIFTTAYNQYALEAFKAHALDYLIKPIEGEELSKSLDRIRKRIAFQHASMLEAIEEKLLKLQDFSKVRIALPSLDGVDFIQVDQIIYCKADGSYTTLVLKDKKQLLSSKSLKEIEDMLPAEMFLRVHNSFLVNLFEVTKFVKNDGGYLLMSNTDEVKVSRQKKDTFLKRI